MHYLRTLDALQKCRSFNNLAARMVLSHKHFYNNPKLANSIEKPLREILELRKSNISNWIIENKARDLCYQYIACKKTDRYEFLRILALRHNFERESVIEATKQFIEATGEVERIEHVQNLKNSLVPPYYWLFTAIGRIENGVKFLVDLRTDVLELLSQSTDKSTKAAIKQLNAVLQELLLLWFSVGFLSLERITWETSCDIIEKVSKYEAIHPVRNWLDLKHRVGPYRRCFVFTHQAMPREPLIVLHTALCSKIVEKFTDIGEYTAGISNKTATFLKENHSKVKAAIFYSISATQKGLLGVQLGNYIIKEVVEQVTAEFPAIDEFASLSPIPGFKTWLLEEIKKDVTSVFTAKESEAIQKILGDSNIIQALPRLFLNSLWTHDKKICEALKNPLMRACARYICKEKYQDYALNKVAHFHLSNGAVVWRINWMAHTAPHIVSASCGIMVNYRYYLSDCEKNSRNYIENYRINIGENVNKLFEEAELIYTTGNK